MQSLVVVYEQQFPFSHQKIEPFGRIRHDLLQGIQRGDHGRRQSDSERGHGHLDRIPPPTHAVFREHRAPAYSSAPVWRHEPRHRFGCKEVKRSAPQPGAHFIPQRFNVQNPRSPPSLSISPDTQHRNQLDGRVPVGSIRVQFFTLELAALRGGQISRRLDVMHELRAGLLVGPSHQLAKRAIEADEEPVSFVVTNSLNQRAVRPPGNPAANLADEPVKIRRRGLPDSIVHQRLQVG